MAEDAFVAIIIGMGKFCRPRTKPKTIALMNKLVNNIETQQKLTEHHVKYCNMQEFSIRIKKLLIIIFIDL